MRVERLGRGRARVTWAARDVLPDVDWDLFFSPTDDRFGGGLLTGRQGERDHFLFLFSPADAVACVLGTDVEHLVVDRLFVSRTGAEPRRAGESRAASPVSPAR